MEKNQPLTDQDVVIVAARRTPIGSFQGALSSLKATELGSIAIKAVLQNAPLLSSGIHEVIMGCVLSAGVGQAPARQAAMGAGLNPETACTTVNKVCGSGMKAVMMACDQIQLSPASVIIAGGMESMSNAPFLLDRARSGYRLGHGKIMDHIFVDGLEDAYETGRLMGDFAENTAEQFNLSRQAQDEYAAESLRRVQYAIKSGCFNPETVSVAIGTGQEVGEDEGLLKLKAEKIPQLKPVFRPSGTITAANSSSLADGAAALLLMSIKEAKTQGLKPLAVVRGYVSHAQEPEWFTTAPVRAIEKLLLAVKWPIEDVDLFEVNEAFAVVPLVVMQKMGIAYDKVNIWGGATTLGHPIGASGARILVTLLHALAAKGLSRGIAALCIGGGEATAIAIERVG